MSRSSDAQAAIQAGWTAFLATLGVPDAVAQVAFRDLVTAYSAPERVYHTLDHIRHVLDVVEALRETVQDLPAVRLAAWFHDVVYDTHAADNEEQSGAYAGQVLANLGLAPTLIGTVRTLILTTKDHTMRDGDSAVLLDADLAILGADPVTYRRYSRAIRQEYGWVPDAAYRTGRAAVLRTFLDRDRIYHTEPLFAAREAAARRNLTHELEALVADQPS